jgi:tripeptide aminopeptidase
MTQEIFTKLVSISSPSGGEIELGKVLTHELVNLGFEVFVDIEGNVLGRSEGNGEPILLSGHLDTVQGSTTVKPIIRDGVVKSEGNTILGADNKAALSSMLSALKKVGTDKRRNLEIVFSVREETDGGVSKIDLSWVKSKSGISADSGEPIGTIVSDTPYLEGFQILVSGKSSHSSNPEKGINALSIAGSAISNFKWGRLDEVTTANIGLIEGGSAVNTTPGQIILTGEIRSYLKDNIAKVKNNLEKVFKSSAKEFGGKVHFEYVFYFDGYSFNKSHSSNNDIRTIYKKLKIKETFRKSFGGSDANFFNQHGINVVDIGDGVFNPHTNNESVSIKDLNILTDIFSSYIKA